MISRRGREVIGRLRALALEGPIPAVGFGPTSVGMTLIAWLGASAGSSTKANVDGVVVKARRVGEGADGNRVNLFAKVPDWGISRCKSSREICERYGYRGDDGWRLYCTVEAGHANTQGLTFEVDQADGVLRELHVRNGNRIGVAAWRLDVLDSRLAASHPETIWVEARETTSRGGAAFHFRRATYTGPPRRGCLTELLSSGTVTMDHLIKANSAGCVEKGPLFKVKPGNLTTVFGTELVMDLLDPVF